MLTLYDYQLECVNKLDTLASGVLVAPTGSGKTMMGAALAWREVNRGGHVAFVVPRNNLASQTAQCLRHKWGLSTGYVLGGEQENKTAKVQVVSYQSLGSKRRSLEWVGDKTTLWIIDECHITAFAQSLQPYLSRCKRKIGLTATPWQLGQRSLLDIFDDPVFAPPPKELIRRGRLAQPIYFITKAKGRLGANSSFIYRQWEQFAYDEKTFVFCQSIAHSDATAEYFRREGVSAVSVTSATPNNRVEEAFEQFKEGEIRVLVSCNKLAEGCDIPDASCVILAGHAPDEKRGKNISGGVQRMGRGARIAPNKTTFKVIDCVGIVSRVTGRFEDLEPTREDFLKEPPPEGDKFPGKECPDCNRWVAAQTRVCGCGHIFDFKLVPCDHPGELERLANDLESRAIAHFHQMMLSGFRSGDELCGKRFFKQYGYYPSDHWVADAKLPDAAKTPPVNQAWIAFKKRISDSLPRENLQLKIPGMSI